jgi:hypothetical protein
MADDLVDLLHRAADRAGLACTKTGNVRVAMIDATHLRAAADEIERLRKEAFALSANQCHAGYAGEYGHHKCREIERLRAERDEARRECCLTWESVMGREAHAIADEKNWDCFKEER